MDNLTEKQYNLAINLLNRIGFTNPKLRYEYLENLNNIISYNLYSEIIKGKCITELKEEVEIKKNLDDLKLKDFNNIKISATDFSSFNFCPASFSISKSFEIKSDENEIKIFFGAEFHKKLRLIDNSFPKKYDPNEYYDSDILIDKKIDKIKNCEVIFSGHTGENIMFYNTNENFVGQPDYIFKDPNGDYFVVEEKFKYLNIKYKSIENDDYSDPDLWEELEEWEKYEKIKRNKKSFYTNHILQVESYIQYIKEYPIKYGVLIYWYYDFHGGKNGVLGYGNIAKVHSVKLKVIKKNDNLNLLNETKNSIEKLLNNNKLEFNHKINLNKCASCSLNKYCGHKTNNIKELSFPYSKKYMELKKIEHYE